MSTSHDQLTCQYFTTHQGMKTEKLVGKIYDRLSIDHQINPYWYEMRIAKLITLTNMYKIIEQVVSIYNFS